MQAVAVPEGDHNPNGYTAAEILRALRGIDGTRTLSFRYELLDSDNIKLADLGSVIEASVSQNWLAEVKRAARFSLRTDGQINFLSDRIKPWVRLHMPAQTRQLPFTINPAWTNRFNGTDGDAVTVENSASSGDALGTVSGAVVYDDTWSADNRQSALLGAGDGTAAGSFTFTFTITPTAVWALRAHLNIPSGARLSIAPEGFTPNTGNDIVIDDIADEYRLGSVDVTAIAADLLDQPLRLEVENDGQTATYRLFWTDPTGGTTPDFTDTEPSTTWDPAQLFEVTGGGQPGTPPVPRPAIDNLTVGQAGPTTEQTPAADNFVEWPQGVFLLSTPSRSADAADVVTRDVEGYDQLQVYIDDKVIDRYTAEPLNQLVYENFEDSTLDITVTNAGNAAWARNNTAAHAGTWGFKSGTITHNQTSDAIVTVPAGAEHLTFWYKVSCEPAFDHFYVLLDGGAPVLDAHGEVAWTQASIDVTGISQVTFRYVKDVSNSVGSDAVWIDEVAFGTLNRYTDEVSDLLGPVAKEITPSDAAIPTAKEWEPGTPKLTIINELLAAINYESLSFNEHGLAVVRPYVSPAERPAEYTYADDAVSVMHPEVAQELDLFTIPNRWVLVVSDPDRAALTSVYTNNDPASPTSTMRRQRTITDFRQEQDAADQAALDAKAARLAFEASQVFEAIDFTSAVMPIHSGNDVLRLVYGPLAINDTYAEQSWEMPLKAGAAMKHRARRVVNIFDM